MQVLFFCEDLPYNWRLYVPMTRWFYNLNEYIPGGATWCSCLVCCPILCKLNVVLIRWMHIKSCLYQFANWSYFMAVTTFMYSLFVLWSPFRTVEHKLFCIRRIDRFLLMRNFNRQWISYMHVHTGTRSAKCWVMNASLVSIPHTEIAHLVDYRNFQYAIQITITL